MSAPSQDETPQRSLPYPRRQRKRSELTYRNAEPTPLRSIPEGPRPSYLDQNTSPLEALCRHFNLTVISLPEASSSSPPSLPETIDVPILHDSHSSTHLFALCETPEPVSPSTFRPILAPVHANLYATKFRIIDLLPRLPRGAPTPVPHSTPKVVTLPIVRLSVPHAPSAPLLLLFGLGLEQELNSLAARLLPAEVIEEFPNSAAMSGVMAKMCSEDQLVKYMDYNQGLWKNALVLGPSDNRVAGMVQTAWGVTKEARRIKEREFMVRPRG